MRNLKILAITLFVISILSINLFGQKETEGSEYKKVKNEEYDAELAKKVGADKDGFKKFFILFIKMASEEKLKKILVKTKPSDPNFNFDKERERVAKKHNEILFNLYEKKYAVTGGASFAKGYPLTMMIIDANFIEQTKQMLKESPYLKIGMFEAKYTEIILPAAIMLVPENQLKLVKHKLVKIDKNAN